MRLTIDGLDLEVTASTPLATILTFAGAPEARWCGRARLDPEHRAGRHPLVDGAMLTRGPAAMSVRPRGPWLEVVAGPDAGGIVAVDGPTVVGREADLSLADPRLSGRHLEALPDGRVRDLGSANGTRIVPAGARPRRARRSLRRARPLVPGDALHAGGSVLIWRAGEAPPEGRGDGGTAEAGPPQVAGGRGGLSGGIGAGALGAALGGAALGMATGRWAMALALGAAPLAAAGLASLWRRRALSEPSAPAPGTDALRGLALPLAIRGSPAAARGAARAFALANDAALTGDLAEPWMVRCGSRVASDVIVTIARGRDIPSDAATVLDVDGRTLRTRGVTAPWTPAIVTEATAAMAVRRTPRAADDLPARVRWADLPPLGRTTSGPRRLVAHVGLGHDGPIAIDLDAHGPHLLVAGTTGSGKSMLLETLVSALAHASSPADLTFALIDFKGGAGLRACLDLPHVRATLTDLEPALARRALVALEAEVRDRKTALAARGAAAWHEWETAGDAPPRLVVVVDEFQELAARDRSFIPQMTRLAAQGRALGLHVVLATQRPAGAVTAEIRANVGATLALRVASPAESHDLVGDASAAALPATSPGRTVLHRDGARTVLQAALPDATPLPPVRRADRDAPAGLRLADAAAERWASAPRPAPLWLPPLPASLAPRPRVALVADAADARSRAPVRWEPGSGPAVVIGPRGSGRTTALRALVSALPEATAAVWLPSDAREAARTLALAGGSPGTVVAIDDVELAIAALERAEGVPGELQLERAARTVALALASGPGWSPRWASRASLRLVLAGLDPTERTLWGVPPTLGDLPVTPGRCACGDADGWRAAQAVRVASSPRTRRLVAPLAVPRELPRDAIGVAGDAARPLAAPRSATVVGDDDEERERACAMLAAHGARVTAASDPFAAEPGWRVITRPSRDAARRWGLAIEPGLIDPDPPPGRVLLLATGRAMAAQLAR